MKALLVVLIIFALVGGFIYYSFPWLFHPFNHAVVEKDFIANIPTIFRTPGGNLELAGISSTETFMSSDTTKFLNWNIPGATTTVIIKVPVIYRYHVPVLDKWDIQVTGNTCLICAPELRPTLPPAIQSEKMEIKTIEGPLAFGGAEQQAKLLQSLTPQLEENAKDSTRLNLVREEARKTVAEFVQTWLLQRDEWGENRVENIKVVFRGEKDFPAESLAPPVEMQESQVQ